MPSGFLPRRRTRTTTVFPLLASEREFRVEAGTILAGTREMEVEVDQSRGRTRGLFYGTDVQRTAIRSLGPSSHL